MTIEEFLAKAQALAPGENIYVVMRAGIHTCYNAAIYIGQELVCGHDTPKEALRHFPAASVALKAKSSARIAELRAEADALEASMKGTTEPSKEGM